MKEEDEDVLPTRFNTVMKIEIGKLPLKHRPIGVQVASVLTDILAAVEQGKKTIRKGARIINPATQKMNNLQKKEDDAKKRAEKWRIERQKELSEQIRKHKEDKLKRMEE